MLHWVSQYTWDPCDSYNSTNYYFLFFFQIWKLSTITTINPPLQCLEQKRENILPYNFFGEKNIQNCLKTDATH